MAKDKKSFRDDLEKLAQIADIMDDTILSQGNINIIIELDKKDYSKVINSFGDVYRKLEEVVIEISDVKFTFVLKK